MAENFHLNKTGNQLGVGFATKKEKKKKKKKKKVLACTIMIIRNLNAVL